MAYPRGPKGNMAELLDAVESAQCYASWNSLWGHLYVVLSALGAVGVALLASGEFQNDGSLGHFLLITVATLPTAATLLDKALRPAQWEAWYARKALALAAIVRHVQSSNPPEGKPSEDGSLPIQIIDWWNLVDEEFEKTRPAWGARDANESEKVRNAPK